MKRKIELLPGLSLFLCFCLLIGSGELATRFGGGVGALFAAELASFLVPTLLLTRLSPDHKVLETMRLRPRKLPRGALGFTIKLGVTVAVLSLFLNFLVYQIAGMTGADLTATALNAPQTGLNAVGRIVIIVILSSVLEELYLRGALFSANEQLAGTSACIIVSGLAFAMLHGNMMNFAGPMAAGMAYAYLTYSFGSIWPAVLAHAVNNIYYLAVVWMTDTYAAFGIWDYFAAINGLLLLLFLYWTLRASESLLAKGYIPRFRKGGGWSDTIILARNPGVLVFVLAFIVKAILHWI